MSDDPGARSILHVDMDAFFVSVELLDRPELRGLPVIVGGAGQRGVVAAASYEARAYGVHSAMPSARARQLCPQAVFLHGRHGRYREVSQQVMDIFRSFTPLVEPISLDEAFLDVTGSRRLHGSPQQIANTIRDRVSHEVGLTCSVGIAANKFVAKLASEVAKPRATPKGPAPGLGVKTVRHDETLAFLHPLPVDALWGVGPATLDRLRRLAVHTVGDLASIPLEQLETAIGRASGRHLHALTLGVDDRPVEPNRPPKSIGHEETFPHDLHDPDSLDRELVRLVDAVTARLRAHSLAGRTVQLKVRFHDFRTITRATTLPAPVDTAPAMLDAARRLLDAVDPTPGVRLLGVSMSGLTSERVQQLRLDDLLPSDHRVGDGPTGERWESASRTVDEIRDRFGAAAIGPASLSGAHGLEVTREGDQPWGPDADR